MKNNFLFSGIYFFVLVMLFTACKKENLTPKNASASSQPSTGNQPVNHSSAPTVKNDRLVFETRDDYDQYLAEHREDTTAISFQGFLSMLDYYNSSSESINRGMSDTLPFHDEYIAHFLNKDGIIQIGNYICKVSMPKEKVFVLNSENEGAAYSALLNEDSTNENIRTFSTSDEVLTLLEEGATTGSDPKSRVTLFCGSSFAGPTPPGFPKNIDYGAGLVYRLRINLHYERAGIYYGLYGDVKSQVKSIFGIWNYRSISMRITYYAN